MLDWRMILAILFWLGLAYLAYVEIGYLALLFLLSRFARPAPAPALPPAARPSVSVLVAAHNEEKVIAARLDNLLAQGYPPDLLQIIVVSDASTDRTDETVRSYASHRVLLCRADRRSGKIAALRLAEPYLSGEIVLFTDADSLFEPGAIDLLVAHFADPHVGAVSGREARPPAASGKGRGEALYNRIETLTKRLEARLGSQVLLHGGIFAMRRSLLPHVPDHLTHDGVVPAMLALQGYRTAYEPRAVSIEAYDLDTRQDWNRRIRTVMQAYQSYLYVRSALNPFKTGFYALQILSHRFARWFVFPVLLLVLLSNLLLAFHFPVYWWLLVIQLACYGLALAGWRLDRSGKRPALFYYPFYFVYIHMAAFYAIWSSWKGQRMAAWRPALRQPG